MKSIVQWAKKETAKHEKMKRDTFRLGLSAAYVECQCGMCQAYRASKAYETIWISFDEQMPPKDTEIILYSTHGVITIGRTHDYFDLDDEPTVMMILNCDTDELHSIHHFTHWMPLPSVPDFYVFKDDTKCPDEMTPIELEQRKKLDERFKGRKLKPVGSDFWDDCGIPVCTCEDCVKPIKDHSHGYPILESCSTCVKGCSSGSNDYEEDETR